MTGGHIYLSAPDVGDEERRLLLDAFDSNWIAPMGPHVDAFEEEVAARAGVGHAAALSSGTAAIELALRLVGVQRGDHVLVSSLTFIGSVAPVVHLGAEPVFIDSSAATWNLDPDLVAEELRLSAARGEPPAAVIAVDLYGQCADYDRLVPLCDEYGVPLIDDAAEALGATWRGRSAGSFGVCGIFSFNGNKIVTTSGGGMLVADDGELIGRARYLSTQARSPAPHYEHDAVGFNYRMSNLCAAVGRGQLRGLDAKVARRRAIFDRYRSALDGIDGVTLMPEAEGGRGTRWLTVVLLDRDRLGVDREHMRKVLGAADIEARPAWKPMHLQPAFKGARAVGGDVSARIFDHGLCLPSGSGLSDADIDRVIEAVSDALGRG
ncbi:MAG: DegT/DnrJ/EryC1/StrS family aminotransferase [Acidimicrobiales bacterium]